MRYCFGSCKKLRTSCLWSTNHGRDNTQNLNIIISQIDRSHRCIGWLQARCCFEVSRCRLLFMMVPLVLYMFSLYHTKNKKRTQYLFLGKIKHYWSKTNL